MRRIAVPIGSTLLSLVAVAGLVQAACPYPLGAFAANGHIKVWDWGGQGSDLETKIVEATLVHGQKSFGEVVNAGGQLHFLYDDEVEYELPDGTGAETQSTYYKEYSNETGWDVPILNLANENVSDPMPAGRNVAPFATSFRGDFWGVWEASGDPQFRANGSYVLLRGRTAAGFTPIQLVSPDTVDSANKEAKIVEVGSEAYIAWQTNVGQNDTLEFRMVGRAFDGTTLGPIENLSLGNDGWTDQVVSLATDGSRVFATWVAANTSDFAGNGDWDVKVAVREANGTWDPEVTLTDSEKALASSPSVAWYLDRVFVAWATDDPRLDSRGDLDIVMESYTPGVGPSPGVLGPLLRVSTDEFQGTDVHPAIFAWRTADGGDGKLHIEWSSDSTPNSIATSGTDNDIFYRSYDGASFSDIRLVSDPLDNGFIEVLPGFFTVGDSLFSYFLSNICLPGCGHETDWREMTRLLERPVHFYDDVHASYAIYSDYPTALATEAHIRFVHSDGSPAGADGYFVKTADGTVLPVTLTNGTGLVTVTFNSSYVLQLKASYCGKDLPTFEDAPPLPPLPAKPSPAGDVVVPALLAAAVLAAIGARRARRG